MSTIATSGSCSSTSRSRSSPRRRLRHHVDPGAPQERRDALAHERAVVGDHDAHGSSAVTTVPAPGGLVDAQVPVQRLDAVGQAVQARSRAPRPRRRRRRRRSRSRRRSPCARGAPTPRSPRRTCPRWPAPRRRRSTPRARRPAGTSLRRVARHRRRHRRTRRQRFERRGEAVVERGRVDAARELAQLLERVGELVARGRRELLRLGGVAPDVGAEHPQLERERDEPLLGAVVQVALEPAALGVAGRDDALARRLHLGEPGLRLRQEALVLEGHRRRGAHRLDHLRVVVERRVVDDRRHLAAVALDRRARPVRRDRRHQHAPPVGVGVARASRAAGRRARASGRRASGRAPPAAPRRASRSARGRAARGRRAPAATAAGRRGTPRARRASKQYATMIMSCERGPLTRSVASSHTNMSMQRGARDARQQRPPARRATPPASVRRRWRPRRARGR